MSAHRDSVFENMDIQLDGAEYHNCRFIGCRMIYQGGELTPMTYCVFRGSQFVFEGAAERTLQFLRSLYHGLGDGGQEIVERVFLDIRQLPNADEPTISNMEPPSDFPPIPTSPT
jgi:hypothetical protein